MNNSAIAIMHGLRRIQRQSFIYEQMCLSRLKGVVSACIVRCPEATLIHSIGILGVMIEESVASTRQVGMDPRPLFQALRRVE